MKLENNKGVIDIPIGKEGYAYIKVKNEAGDLYRYRLFNCKKVEVRANVRGTDVPMLGNLIVGRKATGMSLQGTMEVYKCTKYMDDLIRRFKDTGMMPYFTLQVCEYDKSTGLGRLFRTYKNCLIDGDFILSLLDAGSEDALSQTVTFYANDFEELTDSLHKRKESKYAYMDGTAKSSLIKKAKK